MSDTLRNGGSLSGAVPTGTNELQHEVLSLRNRVTLAEAERNRLIIENAQLRQTIDALNWSESTTVPAAPPRMPSSSGAERPRTEPYLQSVAARGAPSAAAFDARVPPAAFDARMPQAAPPTGYAPSIEEVASFDLSALKRLKPEELDALPYGLVVLDRDGCVLQYNDTESRMARLPKERVLGKNFFRDVAPCTRVREFEGRFAEFASGRTGSTLETFDFVFRFAHGVQQVAIYLTPGRTRGTFNLAMLRRTR